MTEQPPVGDRDELAALAVAAKGGDREAFEELVRRTFLDTYTLAVRLTANEEDARDVVQEAYFRAWKGLPKFRGDAQFSTWMYRITANTASTVTRRRARLHTVVLDDVPEPPETSLAAHPDLVAESAELLGELNEALAELPPKLRTAVILKDVYGLSHEAIAEELGISVAAAKVRLHRGRRKLRDLLYDQYGEKTAHAL